MSAMSDPEPREWATGGGVIAERTNELINAIVRAMNEQGTYRVRVETIEEVAERVLPVGHSGTLADYRVRAIRFGPFEHTDVVGVFELPEEYREGDSR